MTRDDRNKEHRADTHAAHEPDSRASAHPHGAAHAQGHDGHAHGHDGHAHGHAQDHHHDHQHDRKFSVAKAARLDDPARKKLLPLKTIIRLVSPFEGMSFADIGAGTGYCLFPIVEAVEGRGRFYGLDCQDAMNDILRERSIHHRYGESIIPVLTAETHIDLGPETQDVLLCCAVYHELPARDHHLSEMLRVLRPGGRVVVIDWPPLSDGQTPDFGPPNHLRISLESACREFLDAGFGHIKAHDEFEHYWCLTATKLH
ncbi:MAG: methyltransferase domain-containing protein [Deltaproteobacteria bacterium]|nr:methyltransferase domain-containing protein [Deltaproteobacteria bacterium]